MADYTPGPWEVSKSHPSVICGGPLIQFARGQGRLQVAMACGPYESDNATEVQLANARLIAAAPDLLQACRAILEARDARQVAYAALRCRLAIAKAER